MAAAVAPEQSYRPKRGFSDSPPDSSDSGEEDSKSQRKPGVLSDEDRKGRKYAEDGGDYSFREFLQYYRNFQKGVAEWMKAKPVSLRFNVGDRVLCNMGAQMGFMPGIVQDFWVEQEEEVMPYLVLLDGKAKHAICAPSDEQEVVMREVCFPANMVWMMQNLGKPESEMQDKKGPKLRFPMGEVVAWRVADSPDGLDCWLAGRVVQHWPKVQCASGTRVAPYLFEYEMPPGGQVKSIFFYGHSDDHTLVRKPENVPRQRVRGKTPRLETRPKADGSGWEKIDHVTGFSRPTPAPNQSTAELS